MFKNKWVNSNGVIINTEILVKTILKLGILKAVFTMRDVKEFLLSKEWHPLRNFSRDEFNRLNSRKVLSGKIKQPKTNRSFDIKDDNKSGSVVNVIDIGLHKRIDQLGNNSGMSSAQTVYKVILMQQIEWMEETGQKV